MKLNKCKTTLFVITLSLAAYGSHTLAKDAEQVYATYERGAEIQQTALNRPAQLPDFQLTKAIDEREALMVSLAEGR